MTTSTGPGRGRPLPAAMLLYALLLAGCASSGDPTMGITPRAEVGGEGLAMPGVASIAPAPEQPMPAAPPSTAASPASQSTALAAAPSGAAPQSTSTRASVQFLPVVGAPPETVAMLSRALSRSAAERGVTILPSEGGTAPFRLKGYLSALEEGRETVVVYVWDVVDESGNRVSRIQGQERVGGSGSDPWSSVGESAIAAIAGRTIDEFLASGTAAG